MPHREAHDLDYQSADPVRRAIRMRRLRRGLVVGALLAGGVLLWMNYRPFVAKWEAWQRQRAFARALEVPAGDRFPEGKLIYAVPKDFQIWSQPLVNAAAYGVLSTESARATEELESATNVAVLCPLVFLGTLLNVKGERTLVGIAFSHCSVQRDHVDWPDRRHEAGYYLVLSYVAISANNSGITSSWIDMGGHPGFRLAPLDALDWRPQPQHAEIAGLPLSFHGSYVDPQDPSVAVILLKLGERRGRIRASIKDDDRYPSFSVEWD